LTEAQNKTTQKDTKKLRFDSNDVVRTLYGERNCNVTLIEKRLGIAINIRGNDLIMQGNMLELEMAENLLNQLYGLIKDGYPVYERDIDYSIRILDGDYNAKLKPIFLDRVYITSKRKIITPKSVNQKNYIDSIRSYDIVFGIGPAGTGKTYLAMAMAISALMKKEVSRVVLTRPAVEAGEKLGYLPGDLYEKVNPYLRPLYDALHDMMDFENASQLIQSGVLEVAPLAFMRGRTLNDSFIILDEAQNSTLEQMKMFLTRLGFDSKTVITGDVTQTDLPEGKSSGLIQAREILAHIPEIKFVHFTKEDVVRHPLVQKIIDAYERIEK
jgi:phosphate starvation-inducible protein PhoH and related proteins